MFRSVDPTDLTPLQIRRRMRAWAAGMDPHVHAAVELLIAHDSWLRRRDFLTAAVHVDTRGAGWINWREARGAFDAGRLDKSSSTERAVLDLAIALGENRYRLNAMGTSNASLIATAVALSVGLVPPAPRPRRRSTS
jgi:hypothetical protein